MSTSPSRRVDLDGPGPSPDSNGDAADPLPRSRTGRYLTALPDEQLPWGSSVSVRRVATPPVRVERRRTSRWANPYRHYGKRILDVALASAGLVALAPVMGAIALAVRATLGSPVLYRQQRAGLDGEPFEMIKFRTMHHDRRRAQRPYDGPDRRQTHKSDADPRHTTLGRFLRRTSLDELPQLCNVLRGDMSLVGPRPEVWEVAHRNGIVDHVRHSVRPGITGLWQISPMRKRAVIEDGLELDARYARSVTLRGDLRVLRATVPVLLSPNGH